jgi:anti-sigma B factor antagonist
MEHTTQCRVELRRIGSEKAVIAVAGETDASVVAQLKEALLEGTSAGASTIIVDLRQVTSMDSAALGVLLVGAKRARRRNGCLDLVCTDQTVRGILETTGLDRIFGIYRSLDDALAVL